MGSYLSAASPRKGEAIAPQPRTMAANRTLLVSLSPSWLALAWLISRAQWFWKHNPELQFGWVMVLLCAYLIWEAWELKPEPTWRWSVSGCLMALLGCAVFGITQLYQAAYGLTPASMSGLALGVMLVVVANLNC